jgi:hypothetical protein
MERGGVGDGLDVGVGSEIIIGPRYGRELPLVQTLHSLREYMVRIEIWIVRVVAVTGIPACVERELRQVCETRLAA